MLISIARLARWPKSAPGTVQDFTEPTLSFLRQELREYEPLILRLLQERLLSPDG